MRIKSGLFFIALGISLTANSLTLTQAKKLYIPKAVLKRRFPHSKISKRKILKTPTTTNGWADACMKPAKKRKLSPTWKPPFPKKLPMLQDIWRKSRSKKWTTSKWNR